MNETETKEKAVVQEVINKSKDYTEAAGKLSDYFSKKYGSDFGGRIAFSYDPVEEKMKMAFNGQEREFEELELLEIPAHIQFLRKTAAHKKISIKKK